MEYNFNEYVAVQSEMEVLAENKEAMALIKTFDGTAKNSRGAFIAKAVSDLGMNATTAGAYWQRNKKYAISQDASALGGHWQKVNQANKESGASSKLSSDSMVKTIQNDTASWAKQGRHAIPQSAVRMPSMTLETPSSSTKATGYFIGVENSSSGNKTGWVVFPDEGYVNKIWDNTRPVMKSMAMDNRTFDEVSKSVSLIGSYLKINAAPMMMLIKQAHESFLHDQKSDLAKADGATAKDAWSKSLLQAYRDWVSSGQKVSLLDGRYLESQGDGYMSLDGGGYQGRPYRFGAYNSNTYRLLGVVLFPKEGYAYYTDKDGKRCQPAIVTKEFAKELITKVRNLGEVLDISPDSMISSINSTANRIEAESIAAKGAIGDVKKYCAMADSIIKDLLELEKLASVINPHVKNDALSRVVSYQSSEMRKNLTATKQWANDLK